jgi:hypothetical protein
MTSERLAARGVRWYLALAFGLAWVAWLTVRASGITPARLAQFQLAVLPGTFAPAAAAWIVRKWITHEGFIDLRSRAGAGKWGYFLFALLLPQVAVAVIVGMATILGLSEPDFSLQRALRSLLLFFGGPHWILVCYAGILAWVPLSVVCAWLVFTRRLVEIGPPGGR